MLEPLNAITVTVSGKYQVPIKRTFTSEQRLRKQAYMRSYNSARQKEPGHSKRHSEYNKRYRNREWYIKSELLSGAKDRAKKYGIEITITREHIIIPPLCPVFGVPMVRHTPYAPSLDRKDNTKGYTPENTRVISRLANRLKSDATLEQLEALVNYVRS
jgi:hypothetical protein